MDKEEFVKSIQNPTARTRDIPNEAKRFASSSAAHAKPLKKIKLKQ